MFSILKEIKKINNNQSGYLLIGCVFLVLFLSILISSTMMRADSQLKDVQIKNSHVQSFYAAEAGFDRAIFNLRQNIDWRPDATHDDVVVMDGTKPLGYYTIDARPAGVSGTWDSIEIRSIGWDQSKEKPRSLLARVVLADPSQFLVLTAGDLHVGSGVTLEADVLGSNIYFDVNKAAPDPTINVNGDVYYLDDVYGEEDTTNVKRCTGVGDLACELIPSQSITFAGVDINRYEDLADSLDAAKVDKITTSGTHIDLANYPTPYELIYVEGDVYLEGTFETSLIVVASGNIYIEGDVVSEVDGVGDPLHQIGLLADRDVYISDSVPDNVSIEAFVMADGDGASEGVFKALGEKFSKGTLDFNGAISVRGDGANAIDTNVFDVRNYSFNAELSSNSKIPYTPYIADIIEWSEINDFSAWVDITAP